MQPCFHRCPPSVSTWLDVLRCGDGVSICLTVSDLVRIGSTDKLLLNWGALIAVLIMPCTCFDSNLGIFRNVASLHDASRSLHIRSTQHITSCRLFRRPRPHHILHKPPRVVTLSLARAQPHSQARKTKGRARYAPRQHLKQAPKPI